MTQRALLLIVLGMAGSGCEQEMCDQSLEKVCGCGSLDCSSGEQHLTVKRLRKCDSDDMYRDDYSLNVCIQESKRYCDVLNALVTGDPGLCEIPCTLENTCDLEENCHAFQASQCDQP